MWLRLSQLTLLAVISGIRLILMLTLNRHQLSMQVLTSRLFLLVRIQLRLLLMHQLRVLELILQNGIWEMEQFIQILIQSLMIIPQKVFTQLRLLLGI